MSIVAPAGADLGRRRDDRVRALEQVAHAVAAGHVPERAVLELAGQADQRALAVGLDPAGAAERRDQARRHLPAERLQRFHHRLDVGDVAAGVGVLQHRRGAAAQERRRPAAGRCRARPPRPRATSLRTATSGAGEAGFVMVRVGEEVTGRYAAAIVALRRRRAWARPLPRSGHESARALLRKARLHDHQRAAGGKPSAAEALSFVIQKHAASRLHYDFRLELDGTLKSWAVPKGPSLDPADKRMAVHVEDHPIDYAGFEGTIPAGQYGAGEVIVWDRGTWEPVGDARAGYRAGKLKFRLHGEKLHGGWTLVRMHGHANERQEPWLLIKERDDEARPAADYSVVEAEPASVLSGRTIEGRPTKAKAGAKSATQPRRRSPPPTHRPSRPPAPARRSRPPAQAPAGLPAGAKKAALPESLSPQLATLVRRAAGRRRLDLRDQVRRLPGAGARRRRRRAALHPPRQRLERAHAGAGRGGARARPRLGLARRRDRRHRRATARPTSTRCRTPSTPRAPARSSYYLFDLPYCDGHDLRSVPLVERRAVLAGLLERAPASERIRFSENFDAERRRAAAERLPDAPRGHDRQARRFALCLEAQPHLDQAQVHASPGVRDRRLDRPERLAHRASARSCSASTTSAASSASPAASAAASTRARSRRCARRSTASPARRRRSSRSRATSRGHWVQPTLVAEVSFGEWTPDGRIRHSVFHGLRDDKAARSITREQPVEAAEVEEGGGEDGGGEEGGREVERRDESPRRSGGRRRRRAAATPRSRASASAIPTG